MFFFLLLTSLHFLSASMPIVTALQSRVAELVDELGKQGPELASAKQELTRLRGVEAEWSRTIGTLGAKMASLKSAHTDELNNVAAAGTALCAERDAAVTACNVMRAERDEAVAARDAIRADRDNHIAKYEDLDNRH